MFQRQSTKISNDSSSIFIQRKAINSSGCLGSFYDACRDRLLEQHNKSIPRQQFRASGSTKCMVIHGSSYKSRNFLQSIGIEDDLRLSLLLNLIPRIGIAAILNYPHHINDHTRILYYSWINREEHISDEVLRDLTLNKLIKPTTFATHFITGINYGIDVIVVLQLPYANSNITEIDHIFQKLSRSLSNDTDIVSVLTFEENNLLIKNIKMTIYSNIPDLTGLYSISEILHRIDRIRKNPNQCSPLTYFLRPLTFLYSQNTKQNMTFQVLPPQLNNDLEQYLFHKSAIIANLNLSLQENILQFLSGYLEGRLYGIYKQCLHMTEKYLLEIERLSELLIRFRNGQIQTSVIQHALIDKEKTILKHNDNELIQNLNDLEAKARFIHVLLNQNFTYCNVVERDVDKRDNERTIRNKLIMDDRFVEILCSNDTLNKYNPQQLNRLLSKMKEEHQKNPKLCLIYADFTYSSYKLHNMVIFSSNNTRNNRDISTSKSYLLSIKSQPSSPLFIKAQPPISPNTKVPNSSTPLPTDETINILLLGETGVGKSTFINAFANYLTFHSLEQAQSTRPVVIIPVSFPLTISNKFEERSVEFGHVNNSHNEDFNHPGQSITQHCKSYIFRLNHIHGKKLRIIDTPGFGDIRGPEQDDRNMQHILEYINSLTHLNAICFLLKPNTSRLNISFQTCFQQLLSLLGPNADKNIIFCFTNARSTFFTPGNAAPLVKTMLASLSIDDISFKKENTFCFDNESFRYLVALQNKILFCDEDKYQYANSWSTSVKEFNRLIDYIRRNLSPYYVQSGWQSIKHAQFEISHMIRPILETMRNILRNLILYKMNSTNVLIELCPKAVFRPLTICLLCKRYPIRIGHFWIIPDSPHEIQSKCHTCSCPATRHISIDYILEYRAINNFSSYHQNDLNDILHRLCFASAEFSYFLIHGARSTNDDLFMLGLLRMICEEKDICAENESSQMNLMLIDELEHIRHVYEQRMREVSANQDRKTLTIIYGQIKTIRSYQQIREQMIAIKQGQEAIMKQYEVLI